MVTLNGDFVPVEHCDRLVVAFSGGLDSTALLHFVATQFPDRVLAVHIHHGLSPNADAWVEHCVQFCAQLDVEFAVREVNAKAAIGVSPEEAAREARYHALTEFVGANSCLLTAHHCDDQTETVLLQLFRGAGPKGLAAMPALAPFSEGLHYRPLLGTTRQELKSYVAHYRLAFITDESNENEKFDRNYIRHQVLPVIRQRWPSIHRTIGRVALHCAQSTDLIESVAAHDFSKCNGAHPNTLSVKGMQALEPMRQAQVIRFWFHQQQLTLPSTVQLEQIITQFIHSAIDKQPYMVIGTTELRRFADDIFCLPVLVEFDPCEKLLWHTDQELMLPGGLGILSKAHCAHPNLPVEVMVCFRQGGERGKLVGRDHTHTLKKLFQQWGVPPWLRDRIPLLYDGEQLLEVVGYGVFE